MKRHHDVFVTKKDNTRYVWYENEILNDFAFLLQHKKQILIKTGFKVHIYNRFSIYSIT